MTVSRTFSAQAEADLLDALEAVALRQGRTFEAVVGEALQEYVDRRPEQLPRREVRQAFRESLAERDELYRSLAR